MAAGPFATVPVTTVLRTVMRTGPQAGALWSPREAVVDNRALGMALAYAFQRAGGRL